MGLIRVAMGLISDGIDVYKHQKECKNQMSKTICRECNLSFDRLVDYEKHRESDECVLNKKGKQMTREEAIELAKKLGNSKPYYESDIALLEALGLIKFDEPKATNYLISVDVDQFKPEMHIGVARLELWPEGLVLWVGGEIVWKSWEKYYKKGDRVQLLNDFHNSIISGIIE
jgi:hypothetical protein